MYAFTGCEVSSFRGRDNKRAWQTWNVCPQVTELFAKFSQYPFEFSDRDEFLYEMFVIANVVSEYDQEIPQSQTADNPMAPQCTTGPVHLQLLLMKYD